MPRRSSADFAPASSAARSQTLCAAVNSDAVPKDLDRMIDAALDRCAEVLWDDAGHRAPMQVTADRVEEMHGRELRIVEADKTTFAPSSQHAGKVRLGAVGSEPVESPRKVGEADALGDGPNADLGATACGGQGREPVGSSQLPVGSGQNADPIR